MEDRLTTVAVGAEIVEVISLSNRLRIAAADTIT